MTLLISSRRGIANSFLEWGGRGDENSAKNISFWEYRREGKGCQALLRNPKIKFISFGSASNRKNLILLPILDIMKILFSELRALQRQVQLSCRNNGAVIIFPFWNIHVPALDPPDRSLLLLASLLVPAGSRAPATAPYQSIPHQPPQYQTLVWTCWLGPAGSSSPPPCSMWVAVPVF